MHRVAGYVVGMAQGDSRPEIMKLLTFVALLLVLGSCSQKLVPPATPAPPPIVATVPPPPVNALAAGVTRGPSLSGVTVEQANRAYQAFKISCPSLLRRTDESGLTRPEDWVAVCAPIDVMAQPADMYVRWFRDNFALVQVGDGNFFATGYYEPEIAGSRTAAPGFAVPVYRKPADLLDADPLTGAKGRGRLDESGAYVLYHDRTAIEDGALAGRGLEIAWAADAVELFFLQIQGSGRLKLPDGQVMRIGYDGQNGREYVGIGRLLKDRGLLGPGQTSMQGIKAWLRANPEAGKAVMRENKSYIFFQELTGPGPLGALGLPVTPRASVAADPKFVPLGAPVILQSDQPQVSGLWVAQDTGGAIRGANRVDTFWGAGEEAALIAGGMQARGRAYILLPKASVMRLDAAAQR